MLSATAINMAYSSTSRIQSNNDALNCSVCADFIADPRALPCGHSYCGPAKMCLRALQRPGGVLRCAICSTEYTRRIEDLKPLYGIREHLEGYSSEISAYQKEIEELRNKMDNLQTKLSFIPPVCSHNLCENLVSFWCKECEVESCDDCLETDHDKHSVLGYKKHLRRRVEMKLQMLAKAGDNKKRSKQLSNNGVTTCRVKDYLNSF